MKPLGDRIVVKLAPAETKTASGIVIPDTSVKKSEYGFVVFLGTENPFGLAVGDKILIDKMSGGFTPFKYNGEEHYICNGHSIMAKVEE